MVLDSYAYDETIDKILLDIQNSSESRKRWEDRLMEMVEEILGDMGDAHI